MAAPFAAYAAAIQTSPDGATYSTVGGMTQGTLTVKGDMLDQTAVSGKGGVSKLKGLLDATVDIAGDYINGNTGQSNFLFNEGGTCYCKVWFSDGTYEILQGIVDSFSFDVKENGKVSFTAKVVANGVALTSGSGTVPTDAVVAQATPGYSATVKETGTSTPVTGGACTLVSGKTYQLNTSAQRVIDPTVAITVKDNGTPVSASNIDHFDYQFGTVTFISSYTPTTPITMDYSYLPLSAIAKSSAFKLDVKSKLVDTTNFDSNGVHSRTPTVHEASGSFESYTIPSTSVGAQALIANVTAGTKLLIELYMGVGKTFRAWVIFESIASKIKPDAAIENTYSWVSTTVGASASEGSYEWGTP